MRSSMHPSVGYFTDTSKVPAYDPGLSVDCIICGLPLASPLKTVSVCGSGSRSYFYRTHKACYEALTAEEMAYLDSSIIDFIPKENP